jgi:hypothetical protein
MAWEHRKGNLYYYRKRRAGGHVISEYIGAGYLGALVEEIDKIERAETGHARAAWHAKKENAKAIDRQAGEFEKYTKAMTRAVLLLSGYHPHKRQWRKRQDGRKANNTD